MALTTSTATLLTVGAPATPNPRIWGYSTADTIATASGANYWAGMFGKMQVKDIIIAQCSNGTVFLSVSAITATTSTVAAVGSGGNGGQVWVGPVTCTGYGTVGRVGSFISPITGTMLSGYHVTDTVVTADNTLNFDVGGDDATGSIVVALSDTAVDIIDTFTISAGGAVVAGGLVTVETDGAGDTGAGRIWVLIQP